MTNITRSVLASTALWLLAPAAFADLTAQDVWEDWKTYATGFGYQISGQETATETGLVINGVQIETAQPNDDGGLNIALDRIVFTQQADGTVLVTLPSIMPLQATGPGTADNVTRISMDIRQTGLNILASGTADVLRYDYSAVEISLNSTGFEVDGKVLPPDGNQTSLLIEDISGQTNMVRDSERRYDQRLQAGVVRYGLGAKDPLTGNESTVKGQMQAISFNGQSTLPLLTAADGDMDAMLAAGFSTSGVFSFKANAMTLVAVLTSGTQEIAVTTGNGNIGVDLDQNSLSYDITQNALQADVLLSQVPLPLSFAIDSTALNLTLPLRKSDTARDFGLGLSLAGVSMSDVLWGILDPSAQLPRDPATVAFDLSGKARLFFNLLDPADADNLSPEAPPFEVEKLDINRLQVKGLGAELAGKGGFTFAQNEDEPSQLPGDLGLGTPQGKIDLSLSGGNALLDKLIAVGVLPEQQAMGVRMMMGFLGAPGDAQDSLTSEVVINEQGHVLVNGQRIQ